MDTGLLGRRLRSRNSWTAPSSPLAYALKLARQNASVICNSGRYALALSKWCKTVEGHKAHISCLGSHCLSRLCGSATQVLCSYGRFNATSIHVFLFLALLAFCEGVHTIRTRRGLQTWPLLAKHAPRALEHLKAFHPAFPLA